MMDESITQASDGNRPTCGRGALIAVPVSDVGKVWPHVKPWAARSMPDLMGDATESALSQVLVALMSGKLTLWLARSDAGDVCGGLITAVVPEVTGVSNLWISHFFMDPKSDRSIIETGMRFLRAYSAARGCRRIVAFSDSPAVIGFVRSLGGDVGTRFVQMEV